MIPPGSLATDAIMVSAKAQTVFADKEIARRSLGRQGGGMRVCLCTDGLEFAALCLPYSYISKLLVDFGSDEGVTGERTLGRMLNFLLPWLD